jgi:hypothetical protein
MTFLRRSKQRVAFWAAAAFFIAALRSALEVANGGGTTYAGIAVFGLIAGLVCLAGVWTLGLPKSSDPDMEQR